MEVSQLKSNLAMVTFEGVVPINSMEEGLAKGHFNTIYPLISNRDIVMRPVNKVKKVHLILWGHSADLIDVEGTLIASGKQFCENAINYTLRIMAEFPEDKMPAKFADRDIVLIEPNLVSYPIDEKTSRCFPCILCQNGKRGLGLSFLYMKWKGTQLFLAEDITS